MYMFDSHSTKYNVRNFRSNARGIPLVCLKAKTELAILCLTFLSCHGLVSPNRDAAATEKVIVLAIFLTW
jgi:hypothetical protein